MLLLVDLRRDFHQSCTSVNTAPPRLANNIRLNARSSSRRTPMQVQMAGKTTNLPVADTRIVNWPTSIHRRHHDACMT
jgi:hypothetical protein